MTSAPNREMSKRDAAVAINSIAQQARPIGIGQSEFLRTQFRAASKRVKITFPSIFESYAVARISDIRKVKIGALSTQPNNKLQIPNPKFQTNFKGPNTK